jgi:hypothetical protein
MTNPDIFLWVVAEIRAKKPVRKDAGEYGEWAFKTWWGGESGKPSIDGAASGARPPGDKSPGSQQHRENPD